MVLLIMHNLRYISPVFVFTTFLSGLASLKDSTLPKKLDLIYQNFVFWFARYNNRIILILFPVLGMVH